MTTTTPRSRPAPTVSRLLGALATSLLGLGLVVGVPVALVAAVGVPWALGSSRLGELAASWRAGVVDPDAVVTVLTLVVWVAWLRVVVALVLDAAARLTHRPPPQARLLGGSQRMAAVIVTGAAILVSLLARVSSARGATITVQPGDTLSGIAGRVYGDENDWRPIFEANQGRSFAGRVFDDPNLILPGWQLEVPESTTASVEAAPADATPIGTEPMTPVPTDATPVAPVLAETVLADAVPVGTAPLGTAPVGTAPVGTAPVAVEPVTAAPVATTDSGLACATAATPVSRAGGLPTGLGGAILLAGGAVTAVELHRRRAIRTGVRLAEPTTDTATTETVLRRVDATERIARLDVALRTAAVGLRGRSVSVLAALDRADGRILLQLSGSTEPVAPFEPVAHDRWLLPGRVDVVDLAPTARGAVVPCPTLVHLGHGAEGDVYLDVEGVGSLAVEGPTEEVAEVVRAVLGSLAVSPFADVVTVVAVGTDVELGGSRLLVADDVDAAIELVAPVVGVTAAATAGGTTTFALRAQTPDEAWDPAVLVVAPEVAGESAVSELAALTTPPGRGLGVLVGGPLPGAGCRLVAGEPSWTLEPFGFALTPVGVGADDIAAVRRLLEHSTAPAHPDLAAAGTSIEPSVSVGPFVEPSVSLVVRLLGPLRIEDTDGEEVPVEKGKALELVAWLALHREHPSRSSARSALWDVDVRDATFANVVSEARRSLARAVRPPDGEEWIARTLSDLLPLHRGVVTDADLVRARMAHAHRQRPADAVETLRPALQLVRDVPLVGCDATWADAEGHTTDLTMLATSLAQELAERCLDIGDADGALGATAVGLRVLPGHEALVGLRMRARAAAGDLAGVRVEWEAYERVVAADPWSGGTPAAELVTLRRDLLAPTP